MVYWVHHDTGNVTAARSRVDFASLLASSLFVIISIQAINPCLLDAVQGRRDGVFYSSDDARMRRL